MPVRIAEARWTGSTHEGQGSVRTASGTLHAPYSFSSRMENGVGTNPEELLAAAHATCFSTALAYAMTVAGHPPTEVRTIAKVHLAQAGVGYSIHLVELETSVSCQGITHERFVDLASLAKTECPVSRLFTGATIRLKAALQ